MVKEQIHAEPSPPTLFSGERGKHLPLWAPDSHITSLLSRGGPGPLPSTQIPERKDWRVQAGASQQFPPTGWQLSGCCLRTSPPSGKWTQSTQQTQETDQGSAVSVQVLCFPRPSLSLPTQVVLRLLAGSTTELRAHGSSTVPSI